MKLDYSIRHHRWSSRRGLESCFLETWAELLKKVQGLPRGSPWGFPWGLPLSYLVTRDIPKNLARGISLITKYNEEIPREVPREILGEVPELFLKVLLRSPADSKWRSVSTYEHDKLCWIVFEPHWPLLSFFDPPLWKVPPLFHLWSLHWHSGHVCDGNFSGRRGWLLMLYERRQETFRKREKGANFIPWKVPLTLAS